MQASDLQPWQQQQAWQQNQLQQQQQAWIQQQQNYQQQIQQLQNTQLGQVRQLQDGIVAAVITLNETDARKLAIKKLREKKGVDERMASGKFLKVPNGKIDTVKDAAGNIIGYKPKKVKLNGQEYDAIGTGAVSLEKAGSKVYSPDPSNKFFDIYKDCVFETSLRLFGRPDAILAYAAQFFPEGYNGQVVNPGAFIGIGSFGLEGTSANGTRIRLVSDPNVSAFLKGIEDKADDYRRLHNQLVLDKKLDNEFYLILAPILAKAVRNYLKANKGQGGKKTTLIERLRQGQQVDISGIDIGQGREIIKAKDYNDAAKRKGKTGVSRIGNRQTSPVYLSSVNPELSGSLWAQRNDKGNAKMIQALTYLVERNAITQAAMQQLLGDWQQGRSSAAAFIPAAAPQQQQQQWPQAQAQQQWATPAPQPQQAQLQAFQQPWAGQQAPGFPQPSGFPQQSQQPFNPNWQNQPAGLGFQQ